MTFTIWLSAPNTKRYEVIIFWGTSPLTVRCNGGRPYPAADLTKGESPCGKFYGCAKCKAAWGTPEFSNSQLGGRPYPAADLTSSMDVQNVRRREAPQICRACNWRRFLALLTGKSSHPFYMVFMSGGEAHPRRMLLTCKSSHPRYILLGGKPSCFFICLTAKRTLARHAYGWRIFAWYAYSFYTLVTCICYDNGRERSSGVLNLWSVLDLSSLQPLLQYLQSFGDFVVSCRYTGHDCLRKVFEAASRTWKE